MRKIDTSSPLYRGVPNEVRRGVVSILLFKR